MQNRIQIDGVWYVREQQEPEVQLNITRFKGMVTESDKYCFEANKIQKTEWPPEYYDGVDIEFTDKRVKPWKTDLWDNNAWMRGVLINDPVSLEHLRESVCPQGEAELKAFLTKLKEEEWL